MKFTEKRERWGESTYVGRKGGFIFTCSLHKYDGDYYIMVFNPKTEYRLNSLWKEITFPTLEEAYKWCEEFEPTKYEI